MLPETLLNHPYFHRELDEESAKTVLSLEKKSNFLFCKSEKPDRFLLIYKVMHKDIIEMSSISIKIRNSPGRLIDVGNLDAGPMGILKSLYAISQELSLLIRCRTGAPFSPVALLSSDVDVEAQLAAQHAEEKAHVAMQVKKVKMIYKSLLKLLSLPLTVQADPDPTQRIEHRGYIIHSPQYYSMLEISATVISPDHGSAQVFISAKNIKLAPCSAESSLLSDPDLLDRLFELCVISEAKRVLSSSVELLSSPADKKALTNALAEISSSSDILVYQITKNLRLEISNEGPPCGLLMGLYKNEIRVGGLYIDKEMQTQVIALQSSPGELTAYLRTRGMSSTNLANIIDSDVRSLAPLSRRYAHFKEIPAQQGSASVSAELPECDTGTKRRRV